VAAGSLLDVPQGAAVTEVILPRRHASAACSVQHTVRFKATTPAVVCGGYVAAHGLQRGTSKWLCIV